MTEEVAVFANKKEWQTPSLESLTIAMTFSGGSGDEDSSFSGPDEGG